MGRVRIGTCSWADKTMIETWYPSDVSTAEGRLRYYAARFDTVEADSPFYGIPTTKVTENWARRTPEGFVFYVKAYGLMTGHTVDERSLPPEVRTGHGYRLTQRGRVFDPEPEVREIVFGCFLDAVRPLLDAGKLGGVLMQYPPSFSCDDEESFTAGLRRIAHDRELLAEARVLVEFRHASWLADQRREGLLRFLADEDISFVSVDAPRMPMADPTAIPPIAAATSDVAYIRFHGRNASTWHARSASASERFDYLYTPDELEEWEAPIRDLAAGTDVTYAMFNNCRYDYAPRNAHDLASILGAVADRDGGLAPGDEGPGTAGEPAELRLDL